MLPCEASLSEHVENAIAVTSEEKKKTKQPTDALNMRARVCVVLMHACVSVVVRRKRFASYHLTTKSKTEHS